MLNYCTRMSLSEAKQCGFQSCLESLIEKRLIIGEYDNTDKKKCLHVLFTVQCGITDLVKWKTWCNHRPHPF